MTEYLKEAGQDRSGLIKALQLVQGKESYISDDSIKKVAEHFSVSPVEVEGIVTFYTQFKRNKPGKYKVSICDGTACHIKGSKHVLGWITNELGIEDGETDAEGLFSLETVACLGCCSLAPVMSINGRVYGKLDRKSTVKILKDYRKNDTAK